MPDTRINTVKIKDMPESTTLSDSDIGIQDDGTTTHKFKLSTLVQYIKNHTEISNFFVHQSTVNSASGVAPLDSDKKIPTANIRYGKTVGTIYQGSEGAAVETTVNTHVADNNIHVTTANKTSWNDANTKKHTHNNKAVLDGLSEVEGILNYNGEELGGGTECTHPKPTRTDTTSSASTTFGETISVVDNVISNNEGHTTGINVKTITLPTAPTSVSGSSGSCTGNTATATKATNDANGNVIINEMTSATEPTTQKVGDYWVQEYT